MPKRKPVKQVIVVNRNILKKIGKGKLAAQVAHASLSAYRLALRKAEKDPFYSKILHEWERIWHEKKVVLKADEEELIRLSKECTKRGIPCVLIRDAGLTQLKPGTITALGIGPAHEDEIDKLTGHLKLL